MAGRLSATWRSRAVTSCTGGVRHYRVSGGSQGWRKDSPTGSTPEVFVYTPESRIAWPDPQLGVIGNKDPCFTLPGHIGANLNQVFPDRLDSGKTNIDILDTPTSKEYQAQVLYSASDYIKYTPGSEEAVCSDILPQFPSMRGMDTVDLRVHDAPLLIRKSLASMYYTNPHQFDAGRKSAGNLSIVTLSQKTKHDMSKWSDEIEEERAMRTEHFVQAAKEIVARLKEEGFWADFIDPCSGTPFYGEHTNFTFFETDERYRLLGFRIEDLGCCKVICHNEFGRHVFVGSIVTNAPRSSPALDEILEEMIKPNDKSDS